MVLSPYYTNNIPSVKGYYVLVIRVNSIINIHLSRNEWIIKPGIYFYIGSAKGPGGLKARVSRHYTRSKKKHWHIDYLTANTNTEIEYIVLIIPLNPERIDLESYLAQRFYGKLEAMKGFGTSDKRQDYSHLYKCNNVNEYRCLEYLLAIIESVIDNNVIIIIL